MQCNQLIYISVKVLARTSLNSHRSDQLERRKENHGTWYSINCIFLSVTSVHHSSAKLKYPDICRNSELYMQLILKVNINRTLKQHTHLLSPRTLLFLFFVVV